MKKRLLLLALISMVSLSACDKAKKASESVDTAKEEIKTAVEAVDVVVMPAITDEAWVDANNHFGLKLLRHHSIEKSTIASPFSIERAVGLTLDGAAENTAKEMRAALSLPEASELSAAGGRIEQQIIGTLVDDDTVAIRVVNRLWVQSGYHLAPEYLSNAKRDYRAEPTLIDFIGESEASRVTINDAIAEATKDKIKDLIPKDVIDSSTRLVLTNAVYFKSPWAKQFKKEKTEKADFLSPDGKLEVDMMHMTEHLPLYKGERFSALTLAYSGSAHALVVLLPDASDVADLEKLEAKLDPQAVRDIFSQSEEVRVAVALPRFKVESDISLKEVLQKFGMHDAFSDGTANFSKMTPTNDLYIGAALHKAVIEVDEDGTEAAAATAVVMMVRGMPAPENEEPVLFVADHPFTYMLIETQSKAIVFAGRYVGK